MIAIRRLEPDAWEAFRAIRLRALAADPGNFLRTAAEERDRPLEHWREMLESDDGAVLAAAILRVFFLLSCRARPKDSSALLTTCEKA